MTRCLAGDVEAFGGLVERYQRVLYNLSLRMLGNTEDARDATQTAFLGSGRTCRASTRATGSSAGSTGSP